MHVLKLKKPTVTQLKKLLAGHPVKLMRGRGFQLIVHPERYDIVSGCFNRGLPAMVELTPEEVELNTPVPPSPEEHQKTAGIKREPLNKKYEALKVGSGINGLKAPRMTSVAEMHQHAKHLEELGFQTGHKYGTRTRAALGNLYANEASSKMTASMNRVNSYETPVVKGSGLRPEGVGAGGNLIGKFIPHALQSQPYSANFQFQFTLPPQYHRFNNSV
jgi:hypothetical protein